MSSAGEPTDGDVDLDGIRQYLAGTDVEFAILFGSRARGSAGEASDVDIALRFPPELDARERFDRRNRIDAALQEFADGFVDVSDIDHLPTPVAAAALRDGVVLVGAADEIDAHRRTLEAGDDPDERARARQTFIDRLARGET